MCHWMMSIPPYPPYPLPVNRTLPWRKEGLQGLRSGNCHRLAVFGRLRWDHHQLLSWVIWVPCRCWWAKCPVSFQITQNHPKSRSRFFPSYRFLIWWAPCRQEVNIFQLSVGVKESLVESQRMSSVLFISFHCVSCCIQFISCPFHFAVVLFHVAFISLHIPFMSFHEHPVIAFEIIWL